MFDGEVYKQKFGVAMGSPLSPILANLCMEFMEKQFIRSLPEDTRPIFWVRYVDDIFIVYQHHDDKLQEFLNHVNSILPSIKFTVEYEVENRLPFLDVMVSHDEINNTFSFGVYRKPTNNEGYIHYFSSHSTTTKQNIITNMFYRAFRICDPCNLDNEIEHIKNSFSKLAYPLHVIDKSLSMARKKYYNPENPSEFSMKNNITLPYNKQLDSIKKSISHFNSQMNKTDSNISLTFRYPNTIRNRLVKNSSRLGNKESGVYCVPCLECSECYIGETGRNLAVRLEEHKQACRTGNSYNAIATHSLDLDHRIGFSSAKIVYKCNNINIRKIAEGSLISLNSTFKNNKGSTHEDRFIDYNICRILEIDNYSNIAATLSPAALPLYSQVDEEAQATGTYAAPTLGPRPPDPPDDDNTPVRRGLRRSERIRQRTAAENR